MEWIHLDRVSGSQELGAEPLLGGGPGPTQDTLESWPENILVPLQKSYKRSLEREVGING